jgi:hypothetical protein
MGDALKSCAPAAQDGDHPISVQIYKPKLQTPRRANFTNLRNFIRESPRREPLAA